MKRDFEYPGIELLNLMIKIDDNEELARRAFALFCAKFSNALLRYAGALSEKWNLSPVDGEKGVDLTFERVLRHHSFKPKDYKAKEMDRRIEIWLKRILHNVLYDIKNGRTANLTGKGQSMVVIMNTEQLYKVLSNGNDDNEQLKEYIHKLYVKMQGLSENMKIIYLTYLVYGEAHQYLPHYLTAELQKVTGLSQNTIKVYKNRAKKYISKK